MSKVIEGYVLDIATAAGVSGVSVTAYDANTNAALSGVVGLTTNPATTDANGHFKISMDLSPGPVYADAAIPGGNHERRYGLEQMQIGDRWMSDVGALLQLFTDGVVRGIASELAVSVSGSIQQYTVAAGHALVQGYAWTLDSGPYSAAILNNTTLPNRRSIVVLRQFTAGPSIGKQIIDIIYGTADGIDPVLRQGVVVGSDTIWEFPLATLNTAQNAGVSTVVNDSRVYAGNASAVGRLNPPPFVDDFLGALQQFAPFTASGATVAEGPLTLDANHPGVWTLTTGGTNNAKAAVVGAQLLWSDIASFEMIFLPQVSGTLIQRFGFYIASADQLGAVQNGVLVEFDNSGKTDTALTLRKYIAGTPTGSTTLALAAHWFRLEWTRLTNTSGQLKLTDLTTLASVSATLDSLAVAFVKPTFAIQAKSAANYVAAADWFTMTLGGMVR